MITLINGTAKCIAKLESMIPTLRKMGYAEEFLKMLPKEKGKPISFIDGGARVQWEAKNGAIVTIGSSHPERGDFFKHIDYTYTPAGHNSLGFRYLQRNIHDGTYSVMGKGISEFHISKEQLHKFVTQRYGTYA